MHSDIEGMISITIDPLRREELIAKYLCRRLDDATAELFGRHYLECDEYLVELQAGELLVSSLERPLVELRVVNGVLVLRVAAPSYLTEHSTEARALCNSILAQKHTRVLM